MVLADHNATMSLIATQATPADPGLGVEGSDGVVRWSGYCQAHLEQDTTLVIKGGQQIEIEQVKVALPRNLPTSPNVGDLVTFVPLPLFGGSTQVLRVYAVDATDAQFGKINLICRRS